MNIGEMDRRVTIRRRPALSVADRGKFQDAFTEWAAFVQATPREAVEAGAVTNIASGVLTFRTNSQTKTITVGDRAVIDGKEFAVTGVDLPERRTGALTVAVETRTGGG